MFRIVLAYLQTNKLSLFTYANFKDPYKQLTVCNFLYKCVKTTQSNRGPTNICENKAWRFSLQRDRTLRTGSDTVQLNESTENWDV